MKTLTFSMTLLLSAVIAQGAMVDGHVYLEGQTCHCLTKVEIDNSALHLPQYTDCTGYFGPFTLVLPGWHTFTYTRVEYVPRTIVFYVPALGATLPPITLETKALCNPQSWKDYPYTLPGSTPEIVIPHDEGRHDPTSLYRVEWWYLNFHLTDESGRRYAGVVSFFKPPVIGLPGMVLFSIIDLEDGTFRTGARYPLVCTAGEEWLDLDFGVPPFRDQWTNKQCEGHLVPFDYHLSMDWVSDGIAWLELDLGSLKAPMPVGGDGFVEFGTEAWSYYYSHPRVDILGTMYLPGFPALGKAVQGYGWIDHQWANLSSDVTWEWLSIQLEDQRDIMVADVWISGEQQSSFSGGLNYYDENCILDVLSNYTITPLRCWYDAEHNQTYTTQWRVEQPTRQIDLLVTADYEHQIVETTGQILGANFWEGACIVSGTIGGQPVQGTAFAELTHSWPPPPSQGCCMDDGTCRYLPPYLCTAQGGTPKGAGTTCATVPPCPQACCLPSGTCTILLPSACATQNGQSLSPGAVCAPPQACCLAAEGCLMLAPACCLEQGGFPGGPGTDCDNPGLCYLGCCPTSPFGNGAADHTVSPGTTLILTSDTNYHNLAIESGGTVVTNGHTLRVCGTLLNMGTIKTGYSGTWGTGGAGGKGGNPKGAGSDPTGCGRTGTNCTPGQPGQPGPGRAGDGGCGGGGGGGAWSDDLICTFDADGGNGAAGGHGGRGSADVLIYAFRFDNNGGTIHADGENGQNGYDAPVGDSTDPNGYENCGAEYYHCTVSRDLAGGGGGGGQGGDGGDAGSVNIYYGIELNQGTLRANPGQGGSGGLGGSRGGCLDHGAISGGRQLGCSGCEAHGAGGRGAYQSGDCATDGQDGADGGAGAPGQWQLHAVVFPDCNDNGFPDQCEIYHGTSHDCQPNTTLDECDIAYGTSQDCNGNGVPDECEIVDDCDGNGVPDECQTDTDHDGLIDPCDNCPFIYNPGWSDVDEDGVGDVCDPCPTRKPGDVNGDQIVSMMDVAPFVAVLLDPNSANPDDRCAADMNNSDTADGLDIEDFVCVLLAP